MPFPFELKFFFRLICHHLGSFDSQEEVAFLENLLLDFLVKGSENSLDKAQFVVELAGVYRPKLPAPGVAADASPHLSSLMSRQRVEMGSEFLVEVWLQTRIPKKTV